MRGVICHTFRIFCDTRPNADTSARFGGKAIGDLQIQSFYQKMDILQSFCDAIVDRVVGRMVDYALDNFVRLLWFVGRNIGNILLQYGNYLVDEAVNDV